MVEAVEAVEVAQELIQTKMANTAQNGVINANTVKRRRWRWWRLLLGAGTSISHMAKMATEVLVSDQNSQIHEPGGIGGEHLLHQRWFYYSSIYNWHRYNKLVNSKMLKQHCHTSHHKRLEV